MFWRKLMNIAGRIRKNEILRKLHQRDGLEKAQNSTVLRQKAADKLET